jgi:GTP-binding protein
MTTTRVVSAEFSAAAEALTHLPPPTSVEIAFAGRSNVGKSSVMNALVERRGLVHTSATPGRTRKLAFFSVETHDGARLMLVDLPGYGYARRSKAERLSWGELAEGYLLERPVLRAVVLVLDVRRGAEADDLDLLRLIADRPRVSRPPLAAIVVATKLDKLGRAAQKPALARLSQSLKRPVIGFSAPLGVGKEELWLTLRRAAGIGGQTPPSSPPVRSGSTR